MTLKEKRLEELKRLEKVNISDKDTFLVYPRESLEKLLSDSIDMAYKEGRQWMADNIVEIVENEKKKGYDPATILDGITARCKIAVKFWD